MIEQLQKMQFLWRDRMIQIAIVEDEEIYVKQLTEYIRKYQTERGRSIKVTVFGDGEDIDDQIKKSSTNK